MSVEAAVLLPVLLTLVALLALARGQASYATRAALADRVRFDAENGTGYIKTLSAEILQALA